MDGRNLRQILADQSWGLEVGIEKREIALAKEIRNPIFDHVRQIQTGWQQYIKEEIPNKQFQISEKSSVNNQYLSGNGSYGKDEKMYKVRKQDT